MMTRGQINTAPTTVGRIPSVVGARAGRPGRGGMPMKRVILLVLLVSLVVAAALVVRGRQARPGAGTLATAAVARRTLRASVVATGLVRAQIGAEVKVGARVSGRVKRLYANIGDTVKRGQVIAVLEQEDLRAQVDKARADAAAARERAAAALAAAAAQPAQSASLIQQAEETLRTARERYQSAKLEAESQPQETTARIALAEAAVAAAQANLALVKRGARTEEIAQAEAIVRQAEARVTEAQLKLERVQKLLAQGFVPRQEVDSRQTDHDVAVAQWNTAREQLALTKSRTTPQDLDKAQAEVGQAEAALRSARVAAVQDEIKRKALATAAAEVRRAEAALRAAQAAAVQDQLKRQEAAASQAQTQAAQAATRVQSAQLGYATITAPISGIIASVSTQEGETVAAGLTAPTFVTIVNLDKLQVDAYVDETDIGKVTVGQRVTFTVDAYPDREFTGRVAAIYPKAVIEQNVVTYDTVIAIDPTGGRLKPDMTANVTVEVGERRDVLAVPNKAVKREEGERVVYVVEKGKPVRRKVRIGWKDSDYTQIVSGLKEGESVVREEPGAPAGSRAASLPPGATGR
jgi:RND family efflux transporter MFP subunit